MRKRVEEKLAVGVYAVGVEEKGLNKNRKKFEEKRVKKRVKKGVKRVFFSAK